MFRTVLLTGTLALAATATHAQSLAQRGESQEHHGSGDTHFKKLRPWAIVGSWFGATPTGIRQFIIFHADGTVLRSVQGEVRIDPNNPPHTPAFGVWKYLGNGRFGVTIWDLFYDATTAQPIRYNKLRLELTLDEQGNHANAKAVIETVDLQGVVQTTRTGSASFVRIAFEPIE
jgi:hypothetical protein